MTSPDNTKRKTGSGLLRAALTLLLVLGTCHGVMAAGTGYIIQPDDQLTVTIFAAGAPQGSPLNLVVDREGYVNFPFLGKVKVKGMSVDQAVEKLTKPLAQDYFVDPQVIIQVKGALQIFVLGKVERPGAFPYRENLSALDATTMAGGFSKYAAPNRTIITRRVAEGGTETINVDLEAVREGKAKDVQLEPGDRIFVPKSWF
jgi:protein involved in polysaccharide export with SLBB domain